MFLIALVYCCRHFFGRLYDMPTNHLRSKRKFDGDGRNTKVPGAVNDVTLLI